MSNRSNLRDEAVARLGLAAVDGSPRHLDDNDLALLEMNSLSLQEAQAMRKHLRNCERCRALVADALSHLYVDEPAPHTSVY